MPLKLVQGSNQIPTGTPHDPDFHRCHQKSTSATELRQTHRKQRNHCMSMDSTKKLIFQNDIIAQMEKKLIRGETDGYDRERTLYAQDALSFVHTTQPQQWNKFANIYLTDTERHFLDALTQLKKQTSTPPIGSRAPTAHSAYCAMVSKTIVCVFTCASLSRSISSTPIP